MYGRSISKKRKHPQSNSENLFDETFELTFGDTTPSIITPTPSFMSPVAKSSNEKKKGIQAFFKPQREDSDVVSVVSVSSSSSSCASPKTTPLQAQPQQQQLYLDFGQKSFGKRTTCKSCGVMYDKSIKSEKSDHDKICVQITEGVAYSGFKGQTVCGGGGGEKGGGMVVEIKGNDPLSHRQKFKEVKKIMDEEMGFLNSDDANEEKKKVAYLYVLDKKVVGCVTAEIIESAYELVEGGEGGGAICRGRVGVKATLGIHQIWTHRLHRGKKIATKLCDVARSRMVFGETVKVGMMAFSSPTNDGIGFAGKYGGGEAKVKVLVYDV